MWQPRHLRPTAPRRGAAVLALLALAPLEATALSSETKADTGPIVRHIHLQRDPIFNAADRARLPLLPLGLANAVHIDTRPRVIRRVLTFGEGDRINDEQLAESARKLRRTGFFSQVEMRQMEAPGDSVDIVVHTQELWTTALNVSYEKFEDQLLWSLQVRERNFLGTARSFDVTRDVDADRSTWAFGLGDRQLFDGTWRGQLRLSNSDDGDATRWRLSRPFFEISDEWSTYAEYLHQGQSPRLYLTGSQFIRPHLDRTTFEFFLMRRFALRPHSAWRWGVGFDLDHQRFGADGPLEVSDARGELGFETTFEESPPENRRWHSPMLALQKVTRRYEQTRFIFGMGNVEDIPLGWEGMIRAGYSARWLDASETGLMLRANATWFERTGPYFLHRALFAARGLINEDGSQDLRLEAQGAIYHTIRPWLTIAGAMTGGGGSRLNRHRAFGLGLSSGLRAARFRELAGNRLLRANGELRAVYTPGWLSLVTPGAAVFLDYGAAWFEDETDFEWELVRGAVGFGLRLGLNRASADVPIRIDVAWPLLYPTDQESPVLSIGTGHIF